MASDGNPAARTSQRKTSDSGYKWVSSSPSPAVVARLESRFPEIVHVPVPMLEEESVEWQHKAVLVRSFLKWVPAEAFIREFRRAGISGEIHPVSLAFRCHVFRFEDPMACGLVLNRPWVINGQVIAAEAWRPEFFPAEDSIASAMLWLRMPNLPLEYWKEDILRAISEPAGVYCCADPATTSRNRGGFARVAVRIDLRQPLRPGTRVQGSQGPFWQQFIYESLEGFCSICGSLHLAGSCTATAMEGGEDQAGGPVFGSWMSATRQRWTAAGPQPNAGLSASASGPASHPASAVPSVDEGWKSAVKQRRRRPSGPSKEDQGSPPSALASVEVPIFHAQAAQNGSDRGKKPIGREAGEKMSEDMVAVPVHQARAVFKVSEKGKIQMDKDGTLDSSKSQTLTLSNPFASLSSDIIAGGLQGPGPLKRARPVDSLPPRSISKIDKRKGKSKDKFGKSRVDIISSLACTSQPPCCEQDGQEVAMANLGRLNDQTHDEPFSDYVGQGSVDIEVQSVALQAGSTQFSMGGSQPLERHNDSFMVEDQGGIPSTSS